MSFITYDTEDNSRELLAAGKSGFDKRMTQIAAMTADGGKFYNKGNGQEFLKWLSSRPERFVYALNMQYDLGNLFGRELDTLDCTLVGGRMIKAVWGKKIFVDVFNIWPMSVKKLGEAFGLQKLEFDADSVEYVFRDVEIIREAMLFAWQFCDHLGIKHLPPTLGGLCVKLWKHWGGQNHHDSFELCKQAYFGGRVELFKICNDATWRVNDRKRIYSVFNHETPPTVLTLPRTKTICHTDINSLYPSVMTKEFPGPLEPTKKMKRFGVARATVAVPECEFAVLPFRRDDGMIFYPWGKFTGTWTIAELGEAEKQGARILKIHECLSTDESSRPYASFVEKLYAARLSTKTAAESLFFKLLMNNLYGRLGSSGVIGRTVWQTEKNRSDGIPYGEKVLLNYQMPLSEEVNWCHAAYVTAYGRLELLRYMRLVGAERMIYSDTDSCIFDCPGKHIPFATGPALGQMKLEAWQSSCLLFAPKQYQIGHYYKAKGVPKAHQRDFIEKGRASFDLPFKFREAVAFFDRGNSKRLSVWRRVEKFNRVKYDRKRCVENRFFPCKIVSV